MPRAATWTFASDESGSFEEPGSSHVLGGVLLPGSPAESAAKFASFRSWCQCEGIIWPPHANRISVQARARLRSAAAEQLAAAGGWWLFVVASARDREEAGPSLALYTRMLNVTTDLAGRMVASLGGTQLHLRPAQRTKALPKAALERGLAARSPTQRDNMRAMSEAEVRGTMDALRREPHGALPPYPEPVTVRADSAESPDAHPGLALADVGCNALLYGLSSGDALASITAALQRVVVVTLRCTDPLRALDRALRKSPPSLVAGAKILAQLAGDAAGAARNAGDYRGLRDTSYACAETLWSTHVHLLAGHADEGACARALLADAEVELAARSGSYEGLACALTAGWSAPSERALLARRQRAQLRDRTLHARLWRATLECANHRGDVEGAARAVAQFDEIERRGRSQRIAAEAFVMQNLAVVALQNELPCAPERADEVHDALVRATEALTAAVSLTAAESGPADPDEPAGAGDVHAEEALWQHGCGGPPAWAAPDYELASAFGTTARSWAFLGRIDEALAAAMAARARFGRDEHELKVNASIIARIELERARLDPEAARGKAGVLDAALRLCGAHALASDRLLPDLHAQPAARFALDIALRALLWAPTVSFASKGLLEQVTSAGFVTLLSRGGLRSHPTELVARHAAELLRKDGRSRDASTQLLRLSIALCEAAPPASTLQRLGQFTTRLLGQPHFRSEGPAGSIFNPTFEYR